MTRDRKRRWWSTSSHQHGSDRRAHLSGVLAPGGELHGERARGHQRHQEHGSIAVGTAHHLAAAVGHKPLEHPDLIRAQTTEREGLHRPALGQDGELLGEQAEAKHRLAQGVGGTG